MDNDQLERKDQNTSNAADEKEHSGQRGGGEGLDQSKPHKAKVHIATFRGIPLTLHQSVKSIAKDLGVSPGELARFFLEKGLGQIASGEDEIAPTFVPGGYTLYPDEQKAVTSRPRRKRSKTGQKPRSYYGVPREVVQAVLDQSHALGVTQGELARHLLERGVQRYRSGDLALEPVPVQQIATLYPKDLV
jgi:hypothetical protein